MPYPRFIGALLGRFEAHVIAPLLGGLAACSIMTERREQEEPAVVESVQPLSATSCEGRTCFGHGKCVETGGNAVCQCDPGYYAAGLSCLPGAKDPERRYVPAGYQLVFSDEFTGTTLDTTKWSTRAPWNVQWFEAQTSCRRSSRKRSR